MKVKKMTLTVTNVGFILIVVGHCFCSPAPRASTLINILKNFTRQSLFTWHNHYLDHFSFLYLFSVCAHTMNLFYVLFLSLVSIHPVSVSIWLFSCPHLPLFLHTFRRLWWVMLITHPAFVSMLPLWCVHFKILIVMETIPVFICLKNPLQRMKKVGVSD